MIKDIVVALLTTTINRYSESRFAGNLMSKEMVTKDLTGILDYVADLKEDKQPMTAVLNSNSEAETLRKRIRDLEKICKANSEIMNKQCKKIRELQDGNHRWCVLCKQLREKNKILEVENTCFKITDTNDFKVYDEDNLEFYIDEIYYDKEDDKFYFRCKEEE